MYIIYNYVQIVKSKDFFFSLSKSIFQMNDVVYEVFSSTWEIDVNTNEETFLN